MIKKIAVTSICAMAFLGAMSGPVLAGEITGSGKGGPNGDGHPAATQNGHASFCAFSGLEDNDPVVTGEKVQNFGHQGDAVFAGADEPRGASIITLADGTVIGCNKHAFAA